MAIRTCLLAQCCPCHGCACVRVCVCVYVCGCTSLFGYRIISGPQNNALVCCNASSNGKVLAAVSANQVHMYSTHNLAAGPVLASVAGPVILKSHSQISNQNGATSGLEMWFAPSTFGAGGPTQNTSRIQPKHVSNPVKNKNV